MDYQYDLLDRLANIVWRDAAANVLRSFGYTYSTAGMITQVTRETGEKTEYTYDSLDRLTGETRISAVGQTVQTIAYTYDLAGNRTQRTIAVGTNAPVTVTYTLGSGNRLAGWSVEGAPFGLLDVRGAASETIGTNPALGKLWVSNAVALTPSVSGTNFWAHELAVVGGSQSVVAAIGDVAGNVGYATNTFTMVVVTNGSYLYNSAGCVTNIRYLGTGYTGTVGLAWDGAYQLTEIKTNGAVAESFGFDALGRRAWIASGSFTNRLVYDGLHVIAETSNGILTRTYTWGPGIDNLLSIAVYTNNGGTTSVSSVYFPLKDHLGTVHALTDSSGAIVESYRFDAWGRVLGVYDSSGSPIANQQSQIGNRYLFQGREYSWKSGLYYFRARWYDPVTGRWLSNDPLGIAGGLNQYAAFRCNPIMFRDPFGLCDHSEKEVNNILAILRMLVAAGSHGGTTPLPQVNSLWVSLFLHGGPWSPFDLHTWADYFWSSSAHPLSEQTWSVPGVGVMSSSQFGNYLAGYTAGYGHAGNIAHWGTHAGGMAWAWLGSTFSRIWSGTNLYGESGWDEASSCFIDFGYRAGQAARGHWAIFGNLLR